MCIYIYILGEELNALGERRLSLNQHARPIVLEEVSDLAEALIGSKFVHGLLRVVLSALHLLQELVRELRWIRREPAHG